MKKSPDRRTLRIIDANLNRSREGLRVCEDIARFVYYEKALTRELKSARHAVSAVAKESYAKLSGLMTARDTSGDVGKESFFPSEMSRRDYADIFRANIQRVKESLRVLEEIFKLSDSNQSRSIARIRFNIYDIEKRSFKKIHPLLHR